MGFIKNAISIAAAGIAAAGAIKVAKRYQENRTRSGGCGCRRKSFQEGDKRDYR